MAFFRWMFGLPMAAAITLGLFTLMAGLIKQDPVIGEAVDRTISVTPKMTDSDPEPRAEVRPAQIDTPPPEPVTQWEKSDARPGGDGFSQRPEATDDFRFDPGRVGAATPIIRIAPMYPEACQRFGAQGTVLVQFDITDRGEVTNVRILSSDHRCFDRAVIKAVMGWKYPPEARRGVTERFVFQLTD